jgi:cytochrome c oxidase subunit IV
MIKERPHANVKAYLAVFGALLVLTVVTVGVSYLHLPPTTAVLLGVAIASVKAALVLAFFMHLKGERALIYGLLGITVACMAILFILPISDGAAVADQLVHGEAPLAGGPH